MPIPEIKVLLVEDNPTDVLLVKATLAAAAGARFVVTHAAYLAEAERRIAEEPFDVVLLDLGLPDSQGLATFTRARSAMTEIPVIVLSGLGDDRIAMEAVDQGAQDYLPKAGVLDDLLPRAIRYAIQRHRAQMKLARYAAALRQKNVELVEELRMARQVQQALLPHHYPRFHADHNSLRFAHFYRPAASLSGDFFSVLRLSEKKAGVLICDVMGHGVRAALIGTLARGLVDQFLPVAPHPGRFLAALNHELADTFHKSGIESFATAFYYVADLEEHSITFANAGHPNALVLHRDQGQADWLSVNSARRPPLGMLAGTDYPVFESSLEARDSIVLFTDGLFEAENAAGERYGRQRLLDAVNRRIELPCGSLLDELVGESQKFAGSEDFSDDVCLVGMDVVRQAAARSDAA